MKTTHLLLISILLVPSLKLLASDRIYVKPAEDLYCSLLKPANLEIVNDVTHRFEYQKNLLVNALDKWLIEFDIAQDPIVRDSKNTICFGFYNDVYGPNAVAYGKYGIFFGVNLLSDLPAISQAKQDDTLKFILAHEFGHFVQNIYGLKFNYVLPMLSTKLKELNADCIAGYLLTLHREVLPDSEKKLTEFVAALGDPHAVGDHGMATERTLAVARGQKLANEHTQLFQLRVHQIKTQRIINACSQYYAPTR